MARYDYYCPKCKLTFEIEHPMGEHPRVLCPQCAGEAQRVFEASGISFHGSGFYNTDQRKNSHATATTTKSEAEKPTEKSATNKADKKKKDAS